VINSVLNSKIDPPFVEFPKMKTITLSNGRYGLLVKILPKSSGIYGIRVKDNPNNSKFKKYEFYSRLDGRKLQMNIEQIVNTIEAKCTGPKKDLDVHMHSSVITPGKEDVYISIKAVNKSVRPIHIKGIGIELPKFKKAIFFNPILFDDDVIFTKPLPFKLEDGDDFSILVSRSFIEKRFEEEGWDLPVKLKAFFNTNDGRFNSQIMKLDKLN
jgi:hypothetical protein